MSPLLRLEARRARRSASLYAAALLVASVFLLCFLTSPETSVPETLLFSMSFVFILVPVLVAGSIVSADYDGHTLKETVLAGPGRARIYAAKLAVVAAVSLLVFLLYGVLLVTLCRSQVDAFGWGLLASQFMAFLQHTAIVFCLSFLLRSFSALGVLSVALILVYRELSVSAASADASPFGAVLQQTFFVQFANPHAEAGGIIACTLVACACIALGLLIFCRQSL